METVKKYWWLIVVVFGVGGWVASINISQVYSAEKDKSQDKKLEKFEIILQGQHDLMEKLNANQEKSDGKLELILSILLPQATDSLKRAWKSMPQKLELDAFSNPVIGFEWLSITHDYLLATKYKWVNEDSLLMRVEWDKRPALEPR